MSPVGRQRVRQGCGAACSLSASWVGSAVLLRPDAAVGPTRPQTTRLPCESQSGREGAALMYRSVPEREHNEFVAMVRSLTHTVETGEVFADRVVAEHMLRLLGAASKVLAEHPVDDRARCRACARFSWWPHRRVPCRVHDTFAYFFTGRSRFT